MKVARKKQFKRNKNLEQLLKELSTILGNAEKRAVRNYHKPQYPVLLVVGAPRSGSTLFVQWLAELGLFAYPSNLLSRFYAAPYIGAKIQQLLTDPRYNHNDELLDFTLKRNTFSSILGRTKGILGTNEFWYFWRRFIPDSNPAEGMDLQYLDSKQVRKIDSKTLLTELAALESAFGKPLAIRANILQYNLSYLSKIFNKVLFLFTKRHPFYNMQSLLEARTTFYGDIHTWFSAKPREYKELKNKDPYTQIAGQLYYTNSSIEQELRVEQSFRSLTVDYEDFCDSPRFYFNQIKEKLAKQGYKIKEKYKGPKSFIKNNQLRLSKTKASKIVKAYKEISGAELEL